MKNPQAFVSMVLTVMRDWAEPALRDIASRVEQFEERIKAIPAGPKGDPGERGEKGLDGERGDIGPQGDIGPAGPAGEKGMDGAVGPQGEKGEKGLDGAPGEKGDPGEPGPQGPAGDPGPRGEKGDPGANGKDAYELAVEKGFAGTELQWLESLRGKDGAAKDGRDGRDGKDGRDAVEINILPAFEEGKSYPSGVYIRHKGGLVKTTADGYDVIINGVDSESEVALDDGRTIERTTTYTDGTTFVRRHKFATLMHRGTWTQRTYDRGDCVMRDNSSWCCMVDSTETMPGTSKDWQLIARKGDRGKDAPPPAKPQGPVSVK